MILLKSTAVGYLRLSQDELEEARESNPDFPQEARELFENGVSRDGYWTSEKFMKQIENAYEIAQYKFNPASPRRAWNKYFNTSGRCAHVI